MRRTTAYVLMLAMMTVGLIGVGCGNKLGESGVSGIVVDAITGEPVDSAQVYLTSVAVPIYSMISGHRTFIRFTDENGKFSALAPVHAIHIVDVEKEGYLPARQVAHDGEDLTFALERVSSSGGVSATEH